MSMAEGGENWESCGQYADSRSAHRHAAGDGIPICCPSWALASGARRSGPGKSPN